MSVALAPRSASSISWAQTALGSTSGRCRLKQLLKKMSAKDGAITQRMPNRAAPTARARGSSHSRVLEGDQDLRLPPGRPIEHEVGPLAAVRVEAHLGEQVLPPGTLRDLQVVLGMTMSVSTLTIAAVLHAGQARELSMVLPPISSARARRQDGRDGGGRGHCGLIRCVRPP